MTEHHRHRVGGNPDAETVQHLKDEILGGPVADPAAPGRVADDDDAEATGADAVDPGTGDTAIAGAGSADADDPDIEDPDIEDSDTETADTETSPAPVVQARGLGLRTSQGPVFTGVDLAVAAGELVVLVGPAGSGRSSLLLALTARMSGVTGDLTVEGHRLPGTAADGRRIRAVTSVARIGTVVVPEPALTVAASITERAMIDGIGVRKARERFAEAMHALDADLDAVRDTAIEDLSAFDRSVVTVALACLAPAAVIVLDDLGRDLSRTDIADLTGRLARLAATGPAILTTALDAPDVSGVVVVNLPGDPT